MKIQDNFTDGISPIWHITEQGVGQVTAKNGTLYLSHSTHDDSAYSNAQISDYDTSRKFTLKPPLRMTITAQASTANLQGTAGFGFWNHPFAPGESRFDVPQAVWFFFASEQSNMALAKGVQGHGWKAATFNAKRPAFFGLLPTAPLAIPLMNIPFVYNNLWSIGQDAIGVSEFLLDSNLLIEKHRYTIEWLPSKATFYVDEQIVHVATTGITNNTLGFVAWLDNQYAIVSPKGQFGFGLVDVPQAQDLIISEVSIERMRL